MTATSVTMDPRWDKLVRRDPSADGGFFYGVLTTGVYCRPSCPSRRAKPENVRFFPTAAEAEAAGFRPCRRCRPDAPSRRTRDAALVAAACRAMEDAEEPPRLEALAAAAGLSRWHFHRLFRDVTGVTPRAYAAAARARRLRAGLAQAPRVTDAIYDAGFNASSRFYAQSGELIGMTPTAWRQGGAGVEIRFGLARSTLGHVLVAMTEKGICAILLGDDPGTLVEDLARRFPRARIKRGDADFRDHVARVVAMVEQPGTGIDLPLDLQGTAFELKVWQALRAIPPGATASYGEIASRIGRPGAARAVAAACAANKLAVAVPCHRVVAKDGSLAGYRWGVSRKAALLARERKGGKP